MTLADVSRAADRVCGSPPAPHSSVNGSHAPSFLLDPATSGHPDRIAQGPGEVEFDLDRGAPRRNFPTLASI